MYMCFRMSRYQSTVMGSFQTVELIETFINYQESIKRCIALTVDPAASASGTPALKVGFCLPTPPPSTLRLQAATLIN